MQYVCEPNKGRLFRSRCCSTAAGKSWTSNVETRQRGGKRKERMDGGVEEIKKMEKVVLIANGIPHPHLQEK